MDGAHHFVIRPDLDMVPIVKRLGGRCVRHHRYDECADWTRARDWRLPLEAWLGLLDQKANLIAIRQARNAAHDAHLAKEQAFVARLHADERRRTEASMTYWVPPSP